jgi:hypothetical protein
VDMALSWGFRVEMHVWDEGTSHVFHLRIDMFLIFFMMLVRIDLYIVDHLITKSKSTLIQIQSAFKFSPACSLLSSFSMLCCS